MNSSGVAIAGLGMITPLGLDAEQSAASVRAGLAAFEDSAIMDRAFKPFVLARVPDEELEELHPDLEQGFALTGRESRLLRLARPALDQALIPVSGMDSVSPPLFLGLPESQTNIELDPDKLLKHLSVQCERCFDLSQSVVIRSGRAAGLEAVHRACEAITSGTHQVALAGGVDTYNDLFLLAALDMEKRINSASTMDGFVPGEGAAFLLVTSDNFAAANNIPILGRIICSDIGEEIGHIYSEEPYRGEGLANTVSKLFAKTNGTLPPVTTVFSSMNGENHFAKEWGVTYIRHSKKIDADCRIEHPADCLGDTGAACGPMMIGLAVAGLISGNLQAPVLAYASSDKASRSACILMPEGKG